MLAIYRNPIDAPARLKTLPTTWPFPTPGALQHGAGAQGNGPAPPVIAGRPLTTRKRRRNVRKNTPLAGNRRPSDFEAPF